MKKTINIIIFGLLILIFGSYMFTFQVRQDEVAFLSTGGSAGEPIETTGLKFKLPWPFQQLYVFDKRIRLETNDYEQMATKNDTAVVVQLFFGWKIKEAGAREWQRKNHLTVHPRGNASTQRRAIGNRWQ